MVRELKHTEIGDIPVDWELQTFDETFRVLSNNTLSRENLNNRGGAVRNIHYGDILTKFPEVLNCKEEIPYVNDLSLLSSSTQLLQDGDIVIADTAEDETVGKVTEVQNLGDSKLVAGLHTIPCRVKKGDFAPGWLGYYMNSNLFHNQILPYITGIKVSSISKGAISETLILVPPFDEQEKIVQSLNEVQLLMTAETKVVNKMKFVKNGCLSKMFPQKDAAVPEMRLPGFTDAWEQRKLGDVGETYTGLSGKTKADFGHGQARFVTYMNVFSNPISNPEMTEPIEIDPKQNEVEVGDVFFTTSSETPEEVGMSSVLLEKRGKIYLNSFCFGFRPTEKIDSYYLAYMLRSESAREKIILLAQGISRYNISKNKVMEIAVSLPSLDEQKLIGQYFRQLDNLITLHQRKFEKLTNVKKSMLEKMFPQNGSSYPEIRFKGFTDPWEQRKLEDYLTVSAEKNTGNIYGRSDVLSVSGDYGIVNQIEFQGRSFAGASVSNYGVVQTGDVVYTKSPLNSNPYGIIKTNKGKPGIVSTLYAVYHPKENAFSDFIQVYFEQHARMNNYMHPLVNKGAKNDMKVSAENALKGPVCFPSRIEQESISAFFSVLDNLITLHQRELEKLQNIKKSMLEKMFV